MDLTSLDDYDYYGVTDSYYLDYNTTSTDGLSERCESDQQLTIKVFQTSVSILVLLLGLLGNSLVIATFTLYRRLRLRTMTDIFLFHLALADLLLLLTLPLQTGDTLLEEWVFGVVLCKATQASYYISTYSGLLLLACISIDRYVAVAWAQEALWLRSRMLTCGKVASLAVWLVASLLSLPQILFGELVGGESGDKQCRVMVTPAWVKTAVRGAQVAGFCVPFLVMVVCYSLIGRVLLEGRGQPRGRGWQHQRTLRLMVALVAVFLVFQLPYTAVLSLKMAGPSPTCGHYGSELLWEYVTRTLAYTRCCLNPVLYALVGVRFRKDVSKLLREAGRLCGARGSPRLDSCSSASPASPGVTMLSTFSPASSSRSCPSDAQSNYNVCRFPPVKYHVV